MAVSSEMSSWVNDNGVPNGPNNACCSCLTLRLGVIIIGLLSSFFDLLLFTWYSIAPSEKGDSSFPFHFSANLDMSLFTLFLIQLIVNIVLIYGAFNRIPNHTVPWLCINSLVMVIILILLSFILFFGNVLMSMSKNDYVSCLIALGFVGACHLFSCFVVFQFRKNTLEEHRIMANLPAGESHLHHSQGDYSPCPPPSAPPTYDEVSKDVKLQLEDEADEAPPDYESAMQSKACTQRLLKKSDDNP